MELTATARITATIYSPRSDRPPWLTPGNALVLGVRLAEEHKAGAVPARDGGYAAPLE